VLHLTITNITLIFSRSFSISGQLPILCSEFNSTSVAVHPSFHELPSVEAHRHLYACEHFFLNSSHIFLMFLRYVQASAFRNSVPHANCGNYINVQTQCDLLTHFSNHCLPVRTCCSCIQGICEFNILISVNFRSGRQHDPQEYFISLLRNVILNSIVDNSSVKFMLKFVETLSNIM
jgi:hypothetical protein